MTVKVPVVKDCGLIIRLMTPEEVAKVAKVTEKSINFSYMLEDKKNIRKGATNATNNGLMAKIVRVQRIRLT